MTSDERLGAIQFFRDVKLSETKYWSHWGQGLLILMSPPL